MSASSSVDDAKIGRAGNPFHDRNQYAGRQVPVDAEHKRVGLSKLWSCPFESSKSFRVLA